MLLLTSVAAVVLDRDIRDGLDEILQEVEARLAHDALLEVSWTEGFGVSRHCDLRGFCQQALDKQLQRSRYDDRHGLRYLAHLLVHLHDSLNAALEEIPKIDVNIFLFAI